MITTHQQCPKCTGAINTEHYSEDRLVDSVVTYLYCAYCNIGWETLWRKVGELLYEDFTVTWEKEGEHRDITKFLEHLNKARAA